jgi:hypothetical protein
MEAGPKPMAAAAIAWDGRRLRLAAVGRARTNAELWAFCRASGARVVAVDGPCATNGLRLRARSRGWDLRRRGGRRDGEVALAAEGLPLFWTTHATVARFDGAARWIARSLRLFADPAGGAFERIEVYPHGAFRLLGGPLPAKGTGGGRAARLAVLARLVDGVSAAALPDHDALDAGAAALVGALRALGLARKVGTTRGGGEIWMPAADAIARCTPPRSGA